MGITDETLVAYADGQLDGEEALAVERAIAGDAGLAAKLAMMVAARRAVRQAYASPAPVAAALDARVRALVAEDQARRQPRTATVIELASRRRVAPFWQVPAAAMLALAVGAGSVWLVTRDDAAPGGLQVAALSDPAVAQALDSLASGQTVEIGDGVAVSVVPSFRDDADQLCREFEQTVADGSGIVAVVCREDAVWDVRLVVATGAGDADSYSPASSMETLDAYLSASGAGAPLSASDEAAALQGLN